MHYRDLSLHQAKVHIDLLQTYSAHQAARRQLQRYAGGIAWKTVNGADYLVRIIDRRGGARSLGRRSAETEALHAEFVDGKARAKEREAGLAQALLDHAAMAKALRLGRVPIAMAKVLRRLDDAGLLGRGLMVIGASALYAYESVAGVRFDTDLLRDAQLSLRLAMSDGIADTDLLAILRKADRKFERVGVDGFRVVGRDGFVVDVISQASMSAARKFEAVVVGRDGMPAPMICLDPRDFAIDERCDRQQAEAVIELVRDRCPHLPLDTNVERMFPARDDGYAL